MDRPGWIRVAVVLIVCAMVAVVWSQIPTATWDLDAVSAWLAPHRHAWYALPVVVFAFVALSPVPVMLLIAATGIAFGPVLGPIYALAGCLASGSCGFALGRWLGLKRVQELGGERIVRLTGTLKRNGTLAVFLLRKVPAPFVLANIVVGASTVRYRDFVVGTILGMGAMIITLAGFGYQLTAVLRSPSPTTVLIAALFVAIPLTLALLINRALRGARPHEYSH
jgi:phospholipase D1/2